MRPGIKNVAASVRQQLLNRAYANARPFNELLQHYAMERFLYRLTKSTHAGGFVLKGALMMVVWKVPVSRPTMDIDLLGYFDNDIDTIVAVIRDVCGQEVEADGVVFDPATVEGGRIAEDAEYQGVRVRFRGHLGTARILMQIDIGFGDAVFPKPIVADYPGMLAFPSPRLRGYTRESAVAEKPHAMVKRGMLNSRLRDYFDVWLLAQQFEFLGEVLSAAIHATFDRRGVEVPAEPVALTLEFGEDAVKRTQWQAFRRKSQLDVAPSDLVVVVENLARFLRPVLGAMAVGQPFDDMWDRGGPWRRRSN
ncbi:MAG: nucleotidyl transferase AbiEii/AbiGii toxin family protein [Planctomycetes bacterium]|nr:nucleotidyl transferase AbiEii/AbiGii toxin family protein [Planctomycetota bacterium]